MIMTSETIKDMIRINIPPAISNSETVPTLIYYGLRKIVDIKTIDA